MNIFLIIFEITFPALDHHHLRFLILAMELSLIQIHDICCPFCLFCSYHTRILEFRLYMLPRMNSEFLIFIQVPK